MRAACFGATPAGESCRTASTTDASATAVRPPATTSTNTALHIRRSYTSGRSQSPIRWTAPSKELSRKRRSDAGYRAALAEYKQHDEAASLRETIVETTAVKKPMQARPAFTEEPPQRMSEDQIAAVVKPSADYGVCFGR